MYMCEFVLPFSWTGAMCSWWGTWTGREIEVDSWVTDEAKMHVFDNHEPCMELTFDVDKRTTIQNTHTNNDCTYEQWGKLHLNEKTTSHMYLYMLTNTFSLSLYIYIYKYMNKYRYVHAYMNMTTTYMKFINIYIYIWYT